MLPSSKLNMNLIHLNNGYHLKLKHIVAAVIGTPLIWTLLIIWGVA
tara:strand:+ start:1819 stop:1956 length:138 start_codon:yes stop_codon:yes gene_type:complete